MKRLVFLIVFLLMIGSVSAEFNQQNAVNWLNSNIQWSRATIEEIAFSAMALDSQEGANQLKVNKMDASGCFPKNNCNSKDTALATLALSSNSESIADQLTYLEDSLTSAPLDESEWRIQVVTNTAGTCTVGYEGGTYSLNFDEEGKLADGSSWVSFSTFPNFNFDRAVEEINVDCNDLDYVQKISIVKVQGNTFYIIDESDSKNALFEMENGCYATNKDSNTCDADSSFYISWVLNKLGKSITTQNYLEDEANSILYNAMLTDIDNSKSSSLVGMKSQDNSFENKIYTTSFAVNALKNSIYSTERDNSITWIESKQNENTGKIGDNLIDTAAALYLIYSDVIYSGGEDEGEQTTCVTDFDCANNEECINGICQAIAQQCTNDGICTESEYSTGNCVDCYDCAEEEIICNDDGFCDTSESEFNCPNDCPATSTGEQEEDRCGNGVCELTYGEDEFTCSIDCEPEKKASLLWLWLIIIILIIGGAAFFVLTKMKKGKGGNERPSYLQNQKITPQYPSRKTTVGDIKSSRDQTVESELDKSISEARELLKRKK